MRGVITFALILSLTGCIGMKDVGEEIGETSIVSGTTALSVWLCSIISYIPVICGAAGAAVGDRLAEVAISEDSRVPKTKLEAIFFLVEDVIHFIITGVVLTVLMLIYTGRFLQHPGRKNERAKLDERYRAREHMQQETIKLLTDRMKSNERQSTTQSEP